MKCAIFTTATKRAAALFVFFAAVSISANAQQSFDPTGNNLLNGTYNFRQTVWDPRAMVTLTGTITFNGRGSYTLTGFETDTSQGSGNVTFNGVYTISASGYGYLQNPIISSGSIFGLVSNGVFVGSSTEAGLNDFIVAAQASSTASNANVSGGYTMSYLNPAAFAGGSYDSLATFTANGSGTIGNVAVKTYLGAATSALQQTETGVKTSFNNGVGTLTFPTTSQLALRGPMDLFVSPDGRFIFGGTHGGFDFYVGVLNATDSPAFSGLYYLGGVNLVDGTNFAGIDTYYGSFKAGGGTILSHERYLDAFSTNGIGYTSNYAYPSNTLNNYTDNLTNTEYYLSVGGTYRIGFGEGPYLGINLGIKAPTLSGSGVFLDPTGVVNAGSYAPFTADIAPGELLVMYGTNLAPQLTVAPGVPFPQTLGGVQVKMNNIPAALYYVSPGQISAIVPYGITGSVIQIQVINNGQTSNAVTSFISASAPGVFSTTANGIGTAAVLHPDYSLVSDSNPAHPGETIAVFLTGLGNVFPSITDGDPGSSSQLNSVTGAVGAYIDGAQATDIPFAGLAPGLSGLYQMNLTIPATVGAGSLYLDVAGSDAYTSQVQIAVAPLSSDPAAAVKLRAQEKDSKKARPRRR